MGVSVIFYKCICFIGFENYQESIYSLNPAPGFNRLDPNFRLIYNRHDRQIDGRKSLTIIILSFL